MVDLCFLMCLVMVLFYMWSLYLSISLKVVYLVVVMIFKLRGFMLLINLCFYNVVLNEVVAYNLMYAYN